MTDSALVVTGKRILPAPIKSGMLGGYRAVGTVTAHWRSLPDFLIVGAKRAGTTSLWQHLLSHPQVVPMVPAAQHLKSPHYFYWHYNRGPAWYRSHFITSAARERLRRRTGSRVVTGEASPYYLFDPRVPARVRALMPEVRVIIALREPVARAYSHYWERVDQGVESLSFADALAAEDQRLTGELDRLQREPLHYSRLHDWYSYRSRGEYAPQVQRWLGHFPAEQVMVFRSEDMYDDAPATLSRIAHFLGLQDHDWDIDMHRNRRAAPRMDLELRAGLERHFGTYNEQLYQLVGCEPWWPYHRRLG